MGAMGLNNVFANDARTLLWPFQSEAMQLHLHLERTCEARTFQQEAIGKVRVGIEVFGATLHQVKGSSLSFNGFSNLFSIDLLTTVGRRTCRHPSDITVNSEVVHLPAGLTQIFDCFVNTYCENY